MKIKEIEKTVNTSWSPGDHHPTLLAAGTAAQQLDASFNTSAALEIYALNLLEPSFDLELKLSVPCQQRFHKVVWGGTSPGVIVGGCDNGVLEIFNADKLFANEEGRVASPERHTGPVRALDFNPYQKNLLATGASSSEIYIWDMNNTSTPMTPGATSQPFEDVAWLAWNRQVQHILASTFPTRSVVWDLRKSEPIIKLTDTTTRVRWKVVAWHPEVATQLCLASEEDSNPVIQLWDLRFATAPVKSFHGHNRGVLSLAWCTQDPDLLISSGKDNKIFCWNPNTTNPEGEIVCEIPNSQQWIFDVSWCPRNPSLIVSSSCDGHTSIYSLTGSPGVASVSNKIADSFPGMDNYDEQQVQAPQPTVDLKKAPKWLRRPVGAKFGFGGRMSTFGPDGVKLFQVHLDEQFLERARDLERKVAEGRQYEICQGKQDPLWRYLEACYSDDPARAIRDILGYNEESVMKSLGIVPKDDYQNDVDSLNDQFSQIGKDGYDYGTHDGQYGNREIVNGTDVFDKIAKQPTPEKAAAQKPLKIEVDNGVEGKVSRALLIGRVEDAVNICLEDDRLADALVLACATNPDAVQRIHQRYFEKKKNDPLSRIIQALVTEDWETIISDCELSSWKEALTAILTYKKDASQLAELLGSRLEQAGGEFAQFAEVCYIASGNISPLVRKRTSGVPLNIDNIQDLVELVLVAQGAMNSRGMQLLLVDDVAKLLGHYSEMLASEGELEVALSILRGCHDEEIEMLKDRLSYALGLKHLPQQQRPLHQNSQSSQNMASYFGAPSQSLPKVGKSFGMAPTNQVKHADSSAPANMYGKPPAGLPSVPGPTPSSAQPNPALYSQPLLHSAGKAPAGVAPPPVGPPNSSTNFARNSPSPVIQGSSSKKYVVDPSVAGNAPFRSQSAMASPYGQSPGMYGSTTSGYPGSAPAPSPYNFGQDGSYNPSAATPSYGGYSAAPDKLSGPPSQQGYNNFQPGPQQNMYKPSPTPPAQSSMYNPPTQNIAFKPSISNLPPSQQIFSSQNNPASGWNDPPLVAPKTSQPKTEANSQSPITHPLFGTAPPQPEFAPHHLQSQQQMPQQHPPQQYLPQQQLPQQHQGYQNQHHPQQMQFAPPPQASQLPPQTAFQPQPALQSQQASHQPLSGYGEPPGEVAKTPEPVKAVLPQEYAHVQSTFEDLRNKCLLASSNNPLMRRKLEDVARKLEAMYECLSYRKLSPSALSGLEQIVQCVRSSDFHSALSVITQMVSGSDFSQVSPFMTGVKILLQTAQQLRVN
uniref:Protein transport protein Sec31A n=1 Tax=Lygus hesperus TaxID=30085 RepID=A0A0A9XWG9_LYGHE